MILEQGPFQPDDRRTAVRDLGKKYDARVVIFASEHERLETGVFEKSDQLTPFVTWLHEMVGSPYRHEWTIKRDFDPARSCLTTTVYFARIADATMFLFRWSP